MIHVLLVSLQEAPAPALPNLVVGILVLFAGVVVIRHRERIYKATVRGEKRWFGMWTGELLERLQNPFWVGVAGAGGSLMGIVMISYALWRFFSSSVLF